MHPLTQKFVLIDKQAPAELKKAYRDALQNNSAVNATHRVLTALQALIEEAGFKSEMDAAVRQAAARNVDVLDVLREREIAVLEQLEAAKLVQRSYVEACDARKAKVRPVIDQCVDELSRLCDEIKALEKQIDRFGAARSETLKKYKAAGLSDADIELIGDVKPTYGDLAEWKLQLEGKKAREAQISLFFKSVPEFDLSILETAQTDHHSKR